MKQIFFVFLFLFSVNSYGVQFEGLIQTLSSNSRGFAVTEYLQPSEDPVDIQCTVKFVAPTGTSYPYAISMFYYHTRIARITGILEGGKTITVDTKRFNLKAYKDTGDPNGTYHILYQMNAGLLPDHTDIDNAALDDMIQYKCQPME
jgi:hypothetical protein